MFGFVLPVGFILSVLVIWSAWNQRGSNVESSDPMPGVGFSFQDSLISIFTALLAILGSLNLTSLAIGTDPTYPFISLFFVLLVALAPLIYRAGETVGAFLVSSAATLWAAFGVIFSLGLLLNAVVQGSAPEGAQLATLLSMAVIIITIPALAAFAHGKIVTLLKSSKALGNATFL